MDEPIVVIDPCVRMDRSRFDMTPSPPSLTAPLSRAVRSRRKSLKLTQVELARFAGCGPDFVYDLESGKPTLRLDKLLGVLTVLGLELRVADGRRVLAADDTLDRGAGAS